MKRLSNLPHCAKLLLVLLTTTTATADQCDFCDSRWRKVYENDDKGEAVSGRIDDLLSGVIQAQPIRYIIRSLGEEGYAANPDMTFAFSSINFISTSYVSKASWKTFEEEPYHRLLRFNTKGQVLETRYNVNNFTEISHKEYAAGIQWFAKKSSCVSMVLEHARSGTATNGSLDNVISSVVSGHDITEMWNNMITEPCRNVEVTEDGVVVGQFLWYIKMSQSPAWSFVNVYTSGRAQSGSFYPGETYISRVTMKQDGRWFADPCWKHVLTNNENGDGVDGSLSELICSVNRGHRVKVVIGNFSIEADNVRTKSGQISAQLLNRVYDEKIDGKDRGFWFWQMAHTTGTVATLKYWLFNGTSAGEETEKKTIKWFVDTKPWDNVLTTNKNGDVVFGSKADLRTAVENGAEVRVALRIDDSKPASNTPKKREIVCWGNDGQGGCLWHRHGRPCGGHGKPDEGNGEPDEGNGEPDEGNGKPDEGNGKPDEGNGKPDEGNGKPDEGNGKPDEGNGKPDEGNGKPDEGNGKPDEGNGGQGGGLGGSDDCTTQEWTVFKTSNLELGPSGEVSAELLQSVSTEEVGSKEFKIKKDAFWKYMIVTTQGDVDISQRGIGVNRNDGHFSVKYATKWFINY